MIQAWGPNPQRLTSTRSSGELNFLTSGLEINSIYGASFPQKSNNTKFIIDFAILSTW